MRESQAWRILAEEHDAGRTKTQFLCSILQFPHLSPWLNPEINAIPRGLRQQMVQRIVAALDDYGPAYNDHELNFPDVRQARVLACLLFAEQARDEERA